MCSADLEKELEALQTFVPTIHSITCTDHICGCGSSSRSGREGLSRIVSFFACLKESVFWSTMSSHYGTLPHFLSSNQAQHEATLGPHDLLQDDIVHQAPLPEPIQSTSSATEPLSHVNCESDDPRNTFTTHTEAHIVTVINSRTRSLAPMMMGNLSDEESMLPALRRFWD